VPIHSTLTEPDASIKTTLTILEWRLGALRKEINSIEKAIDALRIVIDLFAGKRIAEEKPDTMRSGTGGQNRKVIVEILRKADQPLRISEIAKQAHEHGLIVSKRGYRGVYATVGTVLTRNSKHVFMQIRRGTWDLRDRSRRLTVFAHPGGGKSRILAQVISAEENEALSRLHPFTKSSTVH
jgi:hypothetical protein